MNALEQILNGLPVNLDGDNDNPQTADDWKRAVTEAELQAKIAADPNYPEPGRAVLNHRPVVPESLLRFMNTTSRAMAKCPSCGGLCDLANDREKSMGSVACPKCGHGVTQDNLVKNGGPGSGRYPAGSTAAEHASKLAHDASDAIEKAKGDGSFTPDMARKAASLHQAAADIHAKDENWAAVTHHTQNRDWHQMQIPKYANSGVLDAGFIINTSGNFGHAGRPGMVGGSASGGSLHESVAPEVKARRAARNKEVFDALVAKYKVKYPGKALNKVNMAKLKKAAGWQVYKEERGLRPVGIPDVKTRVHTIQNIPVVAAHEPAAPVSHFGSKEPVGTGPAPSPQGETSGLLSDALKGAVRAPKTSNLGGGINQTLKVEAQYKDAQGNLKQLKAIFKPVDGEHHYARDGWIDDGKTPAAAREVASKETAKLLGIETPDTIRTKIGGRDGTLMEWKDGHQLMRDNDSGFKGNDANAHAGRLTELAVYDMVIGNADRHAGNVLIERKGAGGNGDLIAIHPIDHGLSFPDVERTMPDFYKKDQYKSVRENWDAALYPRVTKFLSPALSKMGFGDSTQRLKALGEKLRSDSFNRQLPEVLKKSGINDIGIRKTLARVKIIGKGLTGITDGKTGEKALRHVGDELGWSH